MYLTRAIRQQGAVSGFRYAFKRATTKEHFQGIVAVQRDCFASPKERTTANALEAMQNYKGGDIHKFVIEASSSALDLPENYLPKTHVNRTVAVLSNEFSLIFHGQIEILDVRRLTSCTTSTKRRGHILLASERAQAIKNKGMEFS